MFDTRKFGIFLSRLRKRADLTQSELGDRLGLTRQAISKYERGDSFPDVSILVSIADEFYISLDELIRSGGPTPGEFRVLESLAVGKAPAPAETAAELVNLAPLLKPSVLSQISDKLAVSGINISSLVSLLEFLRDDSVASLLDTASFEDMDHELIVRLIPVLDDRSRFIIWQKILDGKLDYHLLRQLLPHTDYMVSAVEAAVLEGALPDDALTVLGDYHADMREIHLAEAALWED